MAQIRKDLTNDAIEEAYALTDFDIQDSIEKRFEFRKQIILKDVRLSKDEISYAVKLLNKDFDDHKILSNEGIKRICENCKEKCLATFYCEFCVRNYLKNNFSNWTSENNDIDNLIKKCQLETITPQKIVEWIPYNNFQNLICLNKSGCSEIYTAYWIDGCYDEWDCKEKKLKRCGEQEVILKKLENVKNAKKSWFDEGKINLLISNKWNDLVQCYGFTKDPKDGNYMLVLNKMDTNLRNYLSKYHTKLTWKERIHIAYEIINAACEIYDEKAIHKDLHSGNILYSQPRKKFCISDLGFCEPADKPLNSIYGQLPYIAPEVIVGKEITFASNIYSIGILMWEISSGTQPFINYEHDSDLAMNIINGMRPKIVRGTPLEYRKLMEQCWNADPKKRPDIYTLEDKLDVMRSNQNYQLNFTNINNLPLNVNFGINPSLTKFLIKHSTSKIYNFNDLPDPKNATKEEQEAFHNMQNNLSILNDNNYETKGKSKRNNSNDSDVEDNEINSKKLKVNHVKETNRVGFQYMQRSADDIDDTSDDDDDEVPILPILRQEVS
ncbi:kinase-like domain-containing protein [Rhizophagus irregularis DAOM 181602=DAOM 197198]|uniref:Ste20p n=2 Tax=Rhizophagus irregularis TaxID=588596 RepID=A0A015JBF7_RHIIW|nr:kinase-like domain-containing protein [Rhizophagus irregularis DAOM 181602=DAOM 197198]EXX64245.1 Ste20p [Rhizophagus irregularis DAOM 197198w]POG66467.1 kinase-like domain-containing protein [Rhizophagus irregularis DAOM 181602=DAOM 197198]|eukprot:XP_025173333.1 kinase-like domain-containing protein [Rhizophagus irregularis DAOM 181602=DAOM 197198]